ncbi:bifunctional acetate--CoA ligase family protein/GNAT family N-acetyltransferase [Methylobrevis albus]|uniref:Bifunctional acetate--CoA ligase family protein/GNAT family N-acetyltransferase n=1 Tax=Methylobrevis albus TaxID=2793297 RepID=A0A931I2S6_9HYPH|nr:bifunctional acetate--CoA ligase family protein/GNAT family N-acetyltransferase [Methylobrevis albus]MBH0238235.1 bifunctional acetate--CoA ligase family protein/GNAT family N-acetyltransferase [Methylobrevis albus]
MSQEQIDVFFNPKAVALIGASRTSGSVGAVTAANLAATAKARVLFVNPHGGRIDGNFVFGSVAELPVAPDLGVVAVPPAAVEEAVDALGRRGARGAVIITAGLGRGPGSIAEAVLATARRHGMRLIGPNSIGLIAPPAGLNASFAQRPGRPGDLALISQSGAIITSVLDWAEVNGVGFTGLVSIGDALDVGFADLLDHFALDHRTRAILLYVEAIRDARAFMSAARAAARMKPVVVIKSGRHEAAARAAASHTGALAGVDAVYDAAFRRAGLLRVRSLDELFAAAETLTHVPRLSGRRIAILTNGGGAGVMAVDTLVDLGGSLAELSPDTLAALDAALPATWSGANPIDIIGDAGPERYAAATTALLADRGVDAIVAINCPTALASSREAAEAVVQAVTAHRANAFVKKPVMAAWLGSDDGSEALFTAAHIPCLSSPNRAIQGVMHLVRYNEAQEALTATPPDLLAGFAPDRETARRTIRRALEDERTWLTASEVADVLAAYEIPALPAILCADAFEAVDAAKTLLASYKAVVAKIASPDIIHKSDVGGVELELSTPEAVIHAMRRIVGRARDMRPEARIDGITLHPMVIAPKAVELIAGVADDPLFGPVVVFGRGGTAVEVIDDKALALPPLDVNLALDLVARTRVSRQIAGYRDRKPVDREALAILLVRLSLLVAEHPEIREIDLNPIIADAERIVVVDARISVAADTSPTIVHEARPAGHPRLAIRPYPSEWESRITLKNGMAVLMRPLRPEDERLYPPFFARMSAEDMRLRFFARVREFGHAFIARLTQIDYARAMAFIAIDEATGEMLGAVRLHGDPDGVTGEYAIAVRSDLKGAGLGWALMRRIIAFAAKEGYGRIRGEVLRENRTMLAMCEALGFVAVPEPDAQEIMMVTLDVRSAMVAEGVTV